MRKKLREPEQGAFSVPAAYENEPQHWTAEELLKLPLEERDCILAAQADLAEEEYRTNHDLPDFEAFGEGDLYDGYADEE